MNIPAQLKDFRFFPIKSIKLVDGKKVFEGGLPKAWQTENLDYASMQAHLTKHGGAYGVVAGNEHAIIDIDLKGTLASTLNERLKLLPATFQVRSISGGTHSYFCCPGLTGRRFQKESGELRAGAMFVIGPNCIVENKKYEVISSLPVVAVSKEQLESVLGKYYAGTETGPEQTETKETDQSRSGKEFAKVCQYVRAGLTKEQIFKEMQVFAKWATAPPQYRELTYEKALSAADKEKEGKIKIKKIENVQIGEPDAESLEILLSPNLFNRITVDEFNKKIVGEIETRQTIFLVAQIRLVENAKATSGNLMVNAESSAGKDHIVQCVLSILPKENYIKRTRISENALTYWHNSKFEPDWSWNGKVLYLEDISNKILNCAVFKTMSSGGSSTTVVKDCMAIDVIIAGKPVVILTIALAFPEKETLRRYPINPLDEGIDQTRAIMKRQAKFAEKGESDEYDEAFIRAQTFLKRVKVKVPFAEQIAEKMPSQHVIMRTNFDRFLDYIKASAAFHQFQRKTDEEGYILAEGKDYDIARIAILKTTSNQYMIPLTKDEKQLLGVFGKLDSETLAGSHGKYSVKDLEPHIQFCSEITLRRMLKKLATFGLLVVDSEKRDDVKQRITVYTHTGLIKLEIPEYKELQKNDNCLTDDKSEKGDKSEKS